MFNKNMKEFAEEYKEAKKKKKTVEKRCSN
jgi:hypothetical protein